jgi:hypothetical protein
MVHVVNGFEERGLKSGPARAAKMTPEERSESARKAVLARWEKAKAKTAQPVATVNCTFIDRRPFPKTTNPRS